MQLACTPGREAARALSAGDTSAQGLQGYTAALENCFVMQDLRQFSKVPSFMEGFHRMFDGYPQAIRDIMNTMFVVDGEPVRPLKKNLKPVLGQIGVVNMARDAMGAMKAL